MAEPSNQERSRVEFTITLGDRPNDKTPLNLDEALAMEILGFRFSIFDIENQVFILTAPYTMTHYVAQGLLRFRQ